MYCTCDLNLFLPRGEHFFLRHFKDESESRFQKCLLSPGKALSVLTAWNLGWKLMPSAPTLAKSLSFSSLIFWRQLEDAGVAVRTSLTSTVISLSEDFSSSCNYWFWQHLYLGALSGLWIMSKESCIRQEVKSLITRLNPVVWNQLMLLWDWVYF